MRSLLIIDDDRDIAETVRLALERHGWQVETAIDGNDGLERLRAGLRPQVVLLDLMMPGLNGWQFCQALKADPELRLIRVVLVSGAGDVAETARRVGAVAHLRKPFELSELLIVVGGGTISAKPAAPC